LLGKYCYLFYLGYSFFPFFTIQKNSYFTTAIATTLMSISVKDFFHWESLFLHGIPEYQAVLVSDAAHTGGESPQDGSRDVWTCETILASAYILYCLFAV